MSNKKVLVVELIRHTFDEFTDGNTNFDIVPDDPYCTDEEDEYEPSSYDSSSESSFSGKVEIRQVKRKSRSPETNNINLIKEGNNTDKDRNFYKIKKHACLYCRCLCTKLARHLERKHMDEDLVKEALKATKGSLQRKRLWSSIQKQGDFAYYKYQKESNPLIIPLRRKENKLPSELNFRPCPHCQGFFSKPNLKNHVREFCQLEKTNQRRNIELSSRRLMLRVKDKANDLVKKHIFPRIRMDAILKMLLNDDLAIEFANWATTKFRYSDHNYKMIRSQVKQIGKILLNANAKNNNITSLLDLLTPQCYEYFVEAVKVISGFDADTNTYRSPSVALSSCTLIGKVANLAMTIAIREGNNDIENNITKFKQLLATLKSGSLTKSAMNDMVQNQRQKVIKIPTTSDIHKLSTYISKEIVRNYEKLKKSVDRTVWLLLSELILVHLLVFNRKRPGEMERTFIMDFNSLTTATKDEISSMQIDKRNVVTSYARFFIRGKLNKPVPVLIEICLIPIVKLLISTRTAINISTKNKYLFARPFGCDDCEYLDAAKALQRFTVAAGLNTDFNITATTLRKHLASKVSSYDICEKTISNVADFMGHAVDIHKNIYRQVPVINDVMKIAPFLEDAGGTRIATCSDSYVQKEMDQTSEGLATTSFSQVASEVDSVREENSGTQLAVCRESYFEEEVDQNSVDLATRGISQGALELHSMHEEISISQNNCTNLGHKKYESQPSASHNAKATFKFNEAQIALLERELSEFLKVGEVPSLDHCRRLRLRYGLLHNDITTPLRIQHWISYRIQAEQIQSTPKKKKFFTAAWTLDENAAIKKYFHSFIKKRQYPSSDCIREVCMRIPCLQDRSPRKVKSKLQYIMRKYAPASYKISLCRRFQ